MVTLYLLQVQVENTPRSPAVARAEMERVELEMEMPPLDVKIRPSISSSASLATSGESNTAKMYHNLSLMIQVFSALVLG